MDRDTKKKLTTISIWLGSVTIIRILFYLMDYKNISDPYGYLAGVYLRIENGERVLSSGLAFAYTNALSKFMSFWGGSENLVFWYQLLISTFSLLFVLLGMRIFMNKYAAYITATLLALNPIMLINLRVCSPEEYFLTYFSVIFFGLAVLYRYTRTHMWTRRTRNELIVLTLGIYSGVMLSWNYLGALAILVYLVIMIRNYALLFDKEQLQRLVDGNNIDEHLQVMTIPGQTLILGLGALIGIFFTMLKYTGYSGLTVWEQIDWWKSLFLTLPNKTMDFENSIAINIIAITLIGILIDAIINIRKKRIEDKRLAMEEIMRPALLEAESAFVNRTEKKQGESDSFFITADGRRVNYLENPMAVPKKRDKRNNKFDVNELMKLRSYFLIEERCGDLYSKEQNIKMKRAAEGIEKRVKLKAASRISDGYAERVLSTAPGMPKILGNITEFDFDVDDDDEFDV